MIEVEVFRDKNKNIKKYTISGHAGFDEYGKDIVCAAVSVLGQTALIALVEVAGLDKNLLQYTVDEEIGLLDVTLPKNIKEPILKNTQIILNTLIVGIKSVIESYPKFITFKDREV